MVRFNRKNGGNMAKKISGTLPKISTRMLSACASSIQRLFSQFYCMELGGNPLGMPPFGPTPFVILRLFGLFGFNGLLGLFGLFRLKGLFGLLGLFGLAGLFGLPGFNGLVGLLGLFRLAGLLQDLAWYSHCSGRDQLRGFCYCRQTRPNQTNELLHRCLPRLSAESPTLTDCIN